MEAFSRLNRNQGERFPKGRERSALGGGPALLLEGIPEAGDFIRIGGAILWIFCMGTQKQRLVPAPANFKRRFLIEFREHFGAAGLPDLPSCRVLRNLLRWLLWGRFGGDMPLGDYRSCVQVAPLYGLDLLQPQTCLCSFLPQ